MKVQQWRDMSKRKERLTQVRFLVWLPAKGAKRATQLKSVHAWVALFGSNFIGTINFIAKISGQWNEWKTRVGWGGFSDLLWPRNGWVSSVPNLIKGHAAEKSRYSELSLWSWWMNWNFNVIGYRRWSSAPDAAMYDNNKYLPLNILLRLRRFITFFSCSFYLGINVKPRLWWLSHISKSLVLTKKLFWHSYSVS